jgi:hypothetical protein
MDDDILNFDTRKSTDRRCEFWLEFENGVKFQAEMLDPVSVPTELIPPVEPMFGQTPKPFRKEVIIKGDLDNPASPSNTLLDVNRQSFESRESLASRDGKSILKQSAIAKRVEGMTESVLSSQTSATKNEKQAEITTSNNPSDNYQANKGASLSFTF